jgi:hypothetical protein
MSWTAPASLRLLAGCRGLRRAEMNLLANSVSAAFFAIAETELVSMSSQYSTTISYFVVNRQVKLQALN